MTSADWIVVITAFMAGIGTIITAYAGLVKSRKEVRSEVEVECLERLRAVRIEAETVAQELHRIRMRGGSSNDEP